MFRAPTITLFLCMSIVVATPVSLLSSAQGLNILNSSLFDKPVATDFLQALNATSPDTPEFRKWRIRGTPTFLRIALLPRTITKDNLKTAILDMNDTLNYNIEGHYVAKEQPLQSTDDPFTSSPLEVGCLIGIRTYPTRNPHLTYGIIANVLQGLFDYMYKGKRLQEATFEIHDDIFKVVGVGRVRRTPPGMGEWGVVAEA